MAGKERTDSELRYANLLICYGCWQKRWLKSKPIKKSSTSLIRQLNMTLSLSPIAINRDLCSFLYPKDLTVDEKSSQFGHRNLLFAPLKWKLFSARQHAERAICYRKSVCLSVCPSHGWISQKRLNVSSKFFHHLIGPTF